MKWKVGWQTTRYCEHCGRYVIHRVTQAYPTLICCVDCKNEREMGFGKQEADE